LLEPVGSKALKAILVSAAGFMVCYIAFIVVVFIPDESHPLYVPFGFVVWCLLLAMLAGCVVTAWGFNKAFSILKYAKKMTRKESEIEDVQQARMECHHQFIGIEVGLLSTLAVYVCHAYKVGFWPLPWNHAEDDDVSSLISLEIIPTTIDIFGNATFSLFLSGVLSAAFSASVVSQIEEIKRLDKRQRAVSTSCHRKMRSGKVK